MKQRRWSWEERESGRKMKNVIEICCIWKTKHYHNSIILSNICFFTIFDYLIKALIWCQCRYLHYVTIENVVKITSLIRNKGNYISGKQYTDLFQTIFLPLFSLPPTSTPVIFTFLPTLLTYLFYIYWQAFHFQPTCLQYRPFL